MKEIVNALGQGPTVEKMDFLTYTETIPNGYINENITNATRRMSGEAEFLDYTALNSSLERGLKRTAQLLLDCNCRVNLPSALHVPSTTPLHKAILLGDKKLVDSLLSRGASIAAVDCQGDSPLHLAFLRRQDTLVDSILSHIEAHSNYVNPKNSQGLTHLHIASTRKNATLVENFLRAEANVEDSVNADSPLWPGFTALHFAVEFESPEAVRVLQKVSSASALRLAQEKVKNLSIMVHLLSAENHFLNFGYFTYPSYFHFACMRGDPQLVAEFIKNGADVNTPISRDAVFCPLYSPLHFAVESECVENVKLLLESGAAVEHRNCDNMTALHLAMYHDSCDKQKYTVVDYLYSAMENKEVYLKDDYGLSYLHVACTRNDVELIKKFLDNHHDANARIQRNPRKYSNYTPLHFAVRYRSFEAVELLVERGANVNANDASESGTPLHLACEVGHAGIIDLLLKSGAAANWTRTNGNKTALHLLVESYMGREDGDESKSELLPLARRLVKLGVNVNARDQFDNTALHVACWKLVDGAPMVRRLLDCGANVNVENADEQTPLEMTHFESYAGNADDYMTLYHHVQKLKILGYKVSEKNEGFCEVVMREKDAWDSEHKEFKDKKIAKRKEQRRDEIVKLKGVKLQNPEMSLYDLLASNAKNLAAFARDDVVKRILEEKSLKKEFPVFASFLKLRYEKAVRKGQLREGKAVGKPRQFKRPRLR